MTTLTIREREVLLHVSWGWTDQQIAERFHISPNTVRTHRSNILVKLHVHSTAHGVGLAIREGLI